MIYYQYRIYRRDLQNNPYVFFVFGDNIERIGLGGQAKEMRGEPNAIGVATKVSPSVYMSDENYEDNVRIIDRDLEKVDELLSAGQTVVMPADGIGTGLAKIAKYAPKTNEYLQSRLYYLDFKYGGK